MATTNTNDTTSYNSDHFDLSNWKITLPEDKSGGDSGTAIEVNNLIGYEHSRNFYDAADGAMVFMAEVDGATSKGTKYARSELREMNGTERAAWKLSEGGTLSATLTVDAVPDGSGDTVGRLMVGQIHGASDELVRLYYDEGGNLYFMNDQAGSANRETKFTFKDAEGNAPNVALGEKFSYSIDAHGDTLTVKILADGQIYTSTSTINSVWQSDSFYFKAGVYLGTNETNGTGNGQASFYGLDFSHEEGKGQGGWDVRPEPDPVPSLLGDVGADSLNSSNDATLIFGGAGNDTIIGGEGADHLYGEDDNDLLKGGVGDDVLSGGAGSDNLRGEGGNDVIIGGAGKDKLYGGEGRDIFVFERGGGYDSLPDFKQGEDLLDVSAFGFTDISAMTIVQHGEHVRVALGGEDYILVGYTTVAEVTAEDFIL